MTSSTPLSRAATCILRRDNDTFWLHGAFGIFALGSLFLTFYLTPWRDESQAWLMARDLSPEGLFVEARHDGHPILWHLCLKFLQALGINYHGMFFLNWLFMAIAIWLLFYRSSLPLLARIAVALSPICLLEVSCNARNYAISAALIFTAATLYRNVEKKPSLFSAVLALLANTNVFAAAVSVGISFQFLLEQASSFGRAPVSIRPIYTRYLVSNLILLAGMLLLVAQLIPVPVLGEPIAVRPESHAQLALTPRSIWILFLILPALLIFAKNRGFPRILGGIPILVLALVPTLLHSCLPRHAFMVVLGIIFFIWIYLDDIVAQSPATGTRTLIQATLFIILACFLAKPGGFKEVFKHNANWDSTHTAQAIIENHLDDPDSIMVVTEPDFSTPILMQLKHIRTDYGPPPYPAAPMSFADSLYTRMKKHQIPSLEDIKPLVLKLALAHPSETIMVVSGDPKNIGFDDHDPSYKLIPIYSSPALPVDHFQSELFQVFVLKR
jgi:hypothetical protein